VRAVIVIGVLVGAIGTARAGKSVTIFPLSSGKLPPALAAAPMKLTKALAKSIDAEVANVPIEDAAGLLDCDPEVTTCIEAVSKSVKTRRIVFGSINADEDGAVKVTLTRFDPGPDRQQRTFDLTSTNPDGLADELVRVSAPLFGRSVPPGRTDLGDKGGAGPHKGNKDNKDKHPDPDKDPDHEADPKRVANPDREGPDPLDDGPKQVDTPHGAISGTTWGIIGGGTVVAGLGVVFLVQASGIADQVRTAPMNTPTDFRNLTALEDKGQTRQRLGIGLTAVGVVGLGYGIYRALSERSSKPEATTMTFTPVPVEGGAALVFTMGIR